jgi:dTDP-4-dehydrorhamnose 3,5-epimerase
MIHDAQIFTARSFPDERGYLLQVHVRSELESRGICVEFQQAIMSRSRRGVVRGLHFQWDPPQGKLIRCVSGAVFDVLVDIRPSSPTFGQHMTMELSEENRESVWAPPGLAHGFMALQEGSIVLYECTAEWSPQAEGGVLWNDPALGIRWPALSPIVSAKDAVNPVLSDWLKDPRSQLLV